LRSTDAIAGAEKLRLYSANWGGAVVTDFDNGGTADLIVNGKYFLGVLRGVGGGNFTVMNEAWGLPAGAWSAVDLAVEFHPSQRRVEKRNVKSNATLQIEAP